MKTGSGDIVAETQEPGWPVRAEVSSGLLDAAYSAMSVAMMAVLLISTILVVGLDGHVERPLLAIWWLASNFLALARWFAARFYLGKWRAGLPSSTWLLMVIGGSAVSGALWGATAWWIWPAESPLHQAMVVVLVGGMVAGAVTTLAPILRAAIPFILLAALPISFRLFLEDHDVATELAWASLLFAVLSSVLAWRINGLFRENFEANQGRHRAEADLQREALFDPLTNLPNRRCFLERLQQEFSRARRHKRSGALLFLDLDNFKTINDSLGHHVGDQLLLEVARRLRERFRDEDVAGRLGGDEFVVLLPDLADEPVSSVYETERVASQVRDLLNEPYVLDEHQLFVTASIGVAMFPQDADSYQDVLKYADTAMYRAKAQGRNNYQFFLPDMQEEASRRLMVEKELRLALPNRQLELHYQPQMDVQGNMVGLEALARWTHPQMGAIPPQEFVGIADETMLVQDLHEWVVRQVCKDFQLLAEHCGLRSIPTVSINVSARAFHHVAFERQLLEQLTQAGIPPNKLCLEITETSVMERVESVIEKMRVLRRSGLLFSVDDFGTGYSSLAYLKSLPIDSIKIDRTFVGDVCSDPNDAVIVETILAMARHMGLKAVAEGVEDEQTVEYLKARGCEYFQGWLYGRAMPLKQIVASCCDAPNPPAEQA